MVAIVRRAVIGLAGAALLVYLGLVVFHFANTGDLGSGFRMATSDVNLAIKCPERPGTVAAFIPRSDIEALSVGMSELFGEDTFQEICDLGWPEAVR